jgi:hypothetical protein
MDILRGYVIGVERGITRVRRCDGGVANLTTTRQYRNGENIVMLYDVLRDFIAESYTVSEWAALQDGANLDDTGPEDDEEPDEPATYEDLD